MAVAHPLPSRLLGRIDGKFKVFDTHDPKAPRVNHFDIITYTWGPTRAAYRCDIEGVDWNVEVSPDKLEDIKRLMEEDNIEFMWVDCVCLNQDNKTEIDAEVLKMYDYYKRARKCYILMEMDEVWNPQEIVDNLKFIDHILSHMDGAALASETRLTGNLINRLAVWAKANWVFPMEYTTVRSAAIDMGVLNCYATCISRVKSLFQNPYFTRVWTFQEMLLGKNITIYGINKESISCIGELETWMDLATDATDKAYKLESWIDSSRVIKTASVNAILRIIEEDCLVLNFLQTQVKGISSAKTDIINGGPFWWYENRKLRGRPFSFPRMSHGILRRF